MTTLILILLLTSDFLFAAVSKKSDLCDENQVKCKFQNKKEITLKLINATSKYLNLCWKPWRTTNSDCSKTYNSKDLTDGVIMSPCYPLSYPNQTICKYELIGNENERIQLNFIDFSLTGNHTECYYSDTIEVGMRIN